MKPISNKRAYYDYKILEEFTAGLVLSGAEVKSAKHGRIDLAGSFVTFDRASTPLLVNAHIAPYAPAAAAQKTYDPNRPRRLLLTKKQIDYLRGSLAHKGYTIVPLKIFTAHRLVKALIALAEGKKKFDKRESIKKRELSRKIKSHLNQY